MMRKLLVTLLVIFLGYFFPDQVFAATSYYVAKTGSDSNPGSEASPFLTINRGVDALTAGDTLYVKAGTYVELLNNEIPSGTSWDNATTLKAYPGDQPIMQPNNSAPLNRVLFFDDNVNGTDDYIVIDGLILDGSNLTYEVIKITQGASHIRIQNCELRNSPAQGILVANDANYNEILNNKIHHNGDASGEHGIYLSSDYNLIKGNNIYANAEDAVKLNHTPTVNSRYNTITNNIVHDGFYGIESTAGSDNLIANNLIFNNEVGVRLRAPGTASTNNKIYNNTIYDNAVGISVETGYDSATFSNNLITQNTTGISITSGVTNMTFSYNLISQNTTDVNDLSGMTFSNNLQGSSYTVGLTDPTQMDYSLTAASSAIDAGTTLSEVTTDFHGNPRPRGIAYDIGALERYGLTTSLDQSGETWAQTNWLANANYLASSFSSVNVATSSLQLAKTNYIANTGFSLNDNSWIKQINTGSFTPSSLTGLAAWYKADTINGVSNGGVVGSWTDSSGNSHTAAQAGADALKPTLETNAVNGFPAVKGSNVTGTYFSLSNPISIADDYSMYYVSREPVPTNTEAIIGDNNNLAIGFDINNGGHRAYTYLYSNPVYSPLNSQISGTSYNIWSTQLAGTTLSYFRDGAIATTATNYSQASTAFSITRLLTRRNNLYNYSGRLAEMLIFNRVLNSTEKKDLEAYLNNKYFLPITSTYSTSARNYDYFLSGINSEQLVTDTYASDYLTSITLPSQQKINITAAVYNGGAVDATVAQLYLDTAPISTTYTVQGDGWYLLTATVDKAAGNYKIGLHIPAGQTLYVGNYEASSYPTTGAFNSAIANLGSQRLNDAASTISYAATTPAGTTATVKVRSGKNSNLSDAADFSTCTAISSGGYLSSGGCVHGDDQYVQYQTTLATSDQSVTPAFQNVTFQFAFNSSSSSSSANAQSAASTECKDTVPGSKAPHIYKAEAKNSTSILLYFAEADEPVDHYALEFGPASGQYLWGAENIGGKGSRTYLVQSLSPNTSYYFRVRGLNGCASGNWSSEVSIKTLSLGAKSLRSVSSSGAQKPDKISELEVLPTTPQPSPLASPSLKASPLPNVQAQKNVSATSLPSWIWIAGGGLAVMVIGFLWFIRK